MEFGLLGPVVAGDDGSRVTITAGKQRVVLATLLLRANQLVPAGDLVGAVWEGRPPPAARVTLQNYVKRLRQLLGRAGYERIVTLPSGYLIRVGAGELDLDRFTELAHAGRAAAAAGAWQQASQRLGEALALWRGQPLADVPSAALAAQAGRLAGMRLDAIEERIDADLHLGRHREVVPELQALVTAEPLRERLSELLMLALYRSGQQAAALAVYRQAWRHLVKQAGFEPGPALQGLNQRVLLADPGLLLAAATAAGRRGLRGGGAPGRRRGRNRVPAVRPCLLPAGVAGFTGRSRELQALSAAMLRPGRKPGAGPGPEAGQVTGLGAAAEPGAGAVVIEGTAGVGKTALAVHWARQHATQFPGGQLYLNLRGFGPGDPVPPAEALRGFLDALQVPAGQVPAGLEDRRSMFRRLLAGRRVLVVLDNARDCAQVQPLLPGVPGAAALVTSRARLPGLAGARQVCLDVLTTAEARQMLARRLGAARVAAQPQAAGELAVLCARLPLALAITAARAAAHPGFPLAALAAELQDAPGRLDVLSTGDPATDARAVFSWSCQHLSVPAARMFRLLGVHPGPDITAAAAASLAGTDVAGARRLLRDLTACHLLAEPVPGRFAFHDLLRAYAAEQAAAEDGEARRQARSRMLDHYLHTAHAAALLLNPAREPVALAPPLAGVTPEHLDGHQQARDWFAAERQVLLAAVALAGREGLDTHAWQLPWAMFTFLDGYGQWQEQAALQRAALDAATRLGDMAGQAAARRNIALACGRLGDFDQARDHLAACPALYQQIGDRAGEARVHQSLSWVADQQGRYGDALGHDKQALALFRAISHEAGQAFSLSSAGWHHARLGDYERARSFCRQGLTLYQEIGDHHGEAATWDSLGYAEHHLGRYNHAAACYGRATDLLAELGDRVSQAEALDHLGDTRQAAGRLPAARDAWQQALAILDDLQSPDAAEVRGKLQSLGSPGQAQPPGQDRR